MTTMNAVRLHEPGLGGLRFDQIDVPVPGRGEVLVRVHAAAITRDELEWPTERLPAIPSYELSGVASDGDGVWALTGFDRDGAAAEYTVVPAAYVAPKPSTLGHVESAAIPLAGLTAWQGLFEHGRLAAGERVLITGASGGVGHLAVQLARWRGAELVEDAPDVVFDTVGGEVLARAASAVQRGGPVVSVAEEADGATYFVVEPNREQLIELARLVDGGVLTPEIDSVFALTDARRAFERVAERGKHGKVVLEIGRGSM